MSIRTALLSGCGWLSMRAVPCSESENDFSTARRISWSSIAVNRVFFQIIWMRLPTRWNRIGPSPITCAASRNDSPMPVSRVTDTMKSLSS
jgi:hypothetical protein